MHKFLYTPEWLRLSACISFSPFSLTLILRHLRYIYQFQLKITPLRSDLYTCLYFSNDRNLPNCFFAVYQNKFQMSLNNLEEDKSCLKHSDLNTWLSELKSAYKGLCSICKKSSRKQILGQLPMGFFYKFFKSYPCNSLCDHINFASKSQS